MGVSQQVVYVSITKVKLKGCCIGPFARGEERRTAPNMQLLFSLSLVLFRTLYKQADV